MNPDEFYEYEGRFYQNPTKTRDETLTFVDSLRDTVGRDNQAIATQTEMLGTNVPSNLGGLTGSEGYFAQRYQTTPIETQVSALKATAQADALNKLMTNYRNQAQNRYQQAYRSAAVRAKASPSEIGMKGEYNQSEGETGMVEYPGTMPIGSDIWGDRDVRLYEDIDTNYRIYKDINTGEILQVLNAKNEPVDQEKDPYYRIMSDGMFHRVDSPEYRNAVSRVQQNKFWSDLSTALWAPGYALGQGIGEWIRGK